MVSDVLSARQGIAVLVFLDEDRQPTEPELLVPCTPDASLPIDVHVGADHPNEQTFGTAFAHFAALAFPSVALLRKGFHSLSPIMVCTLSSVSILRCPSLSFDVALRGLHSLGFDVLSRSQHELLAHGLTPSSSASADLNWCPCPASRIPRTGSANRGNITWHTQPMANAAMIEAGSLIMIYCIVINEQLSSTMHGEQNAKSTETND